MTDIKHPPFEAIREVLDQFWLSQGDEEVNRGHTFFSLVEVRHWLDACGEDRPSEMVRAQWAEMARICLGDLGDDAVADAIERARHAYMTSRGDTYAQNEPAAAATPETTR